MKTGTWYVSVKSVKDRFLRSSHLSVGEALDFWDSTEYSKQAIEDLLARGISVDAQLESAGRKRKRRKKKPV